MLWGRPLNISCVDCVCVFKLSTTLSRLSYVQITVTIIIVYIISMYIAIVMIQITVYTESPHIRFFMYTVEFDLF